MLAPFLEQVFYLNSSRQLEGWSNVFPPASFSLKITVENNQYPEEARFRVADSAPLDSGAYGAEAGWWDDDSETHLVSLCGVRSFCCAADLNLSLPSFVTLSVWPFKLCFYFAEMGMIMVYSSLMWWGGVNETIQMKLLAPCLGHRKDPASREALLLANLTWGPAQLTTEHKVSQLAFAARWHWQSWKNRKTSSSKRNLWDLSILEQENARQNARRSCLPFRQSTGLPCSDQE